MIARRGARLAVLAALAYAAPAAADPSDYAVALGGAFLATGAQGDRERGTLELSALLHDRLGVLATWQDVDRGHAGLVTAGVLFVAAAARPHLVLELHAELGADLDAGAPLVGGGIRTTLGVVGPFGVAADANAELVIDGVDATRLVLATQLLAIAIW